MKHSILVCAATLIVLGIGGTTSFGATLTTSAVFSFGTGSAVSCLVTNVSSKPITVDVEIFDTVAITTKSLATGQVIAPNGTYSNSPSGTFWGFCRFKITKGGGKASVRAYACATVSGHEGCVNQSEAR
jgi:hypothetical protein